jgi:hypothetical protein
MHRRVSLSHFRSERKYGAMLTSIALLHSARQRNRRAMSERDRQRRANHCQHMAQQWDRRMRIWAILSFPAVAGMCTLFPPMGCTAVQGAISICGGGRSLLSVTAYELAYNRVGEEWDEAHGFA